MSFFSSVVLLFYVIVCAMLIALILMQHGKGADLGASFASGSSSSLFGASGSGNFLTKLTTFLTILFFALCLLLAHLNAQHGAVQGSIMESSDEMHVQVSMDEIPD